MAEGTSGDIVAESGALAANARVREIFEREMGVTLSNFRAGSPRDEAMRNLTHETANLYAKRVLRELIQNAFDGAAAAEAPRILLRLDMQRGPHGTLYVANNGQGFTEYNLDAVVSPAMSNKSPGNFIGHKGLGFRSVELLSDDVRIYSMRGEGQLGAPAFDGYCFGFAQRQDELAWLHQADADDVAEQVAGRVHRLQLPVALDQALGDVRVFAEAGYATVICLPLRDSLAADRAQDELRLLSDEEAPITLFLHRLSALTIERVELGGTRSSSSLSRQARPLDIAAEGLSLEEVTVDGRRFVVARSATDEAGFRQSVENAVAARHPVERWREWEKAPTIAVALPLSGDATVGAYYAFLPMERVAPFAGCLDAPFFPESDRRDLDLSNPLNSFLLDEVAGLCVRLAGALADADEIRPTLVNAAIDALAWTDESERLLEACERLGLEPGALRLPAMKRAGVSTRWAQIDEIYDWDDDKYRTLQRSLLIKVCDLPILPARLGEKRRDNLTAFVDETGYVLSPPASEWSQWAPMIAADLVRRRRPSRLEWEGFYADLASMPLALPGLRGKLIFRLGDGSLAPASGGSGGDGEELFLSVGEAPGGRRGRVGGAVRIPPASIVKKMRFVDPQICWPSAVAAPFFAAQLATEYNLPRLLAKLGKMMGKRAKRATVVAALGWAFEVWTSQRSPDLDQALKLAGLLLPAKDGGIKAPAACYFGAGWRDTRGDLLADFLAAAPAEARTLKDLRAGLLPEWEAWPLKDRGTIGEWVLFLRLLGVVDGLRPIQYSALNRFISEWVGFMSRDGAPPNVEGSFGTYWRSALRTDTPWEKFRYSSGQYSTNDTLLGLPGQGEFVRFEPEAKLAYAKLIMASLPEFSTQWFTTYFSRTAGNSDIVSVPSPMAAFLRRAAWLPVNAGAELAWKRPAQAWFVARPDSLPRFISGIERSVRELLEGHKTTQELLTSRLGLRLWNDAASAVDRLSTLGSLLAEGVPEPEHDAFRKAYREAWEHWATRSPRSRLPNPLILAVQADSKPRTLALADPDRPTVFVSDGADPMREQLIGALGHLVLTLPGQVAELVAAALQGQFGEGFPLLANADLTIRCDGEVFAPSPAARSLVEAGQEWLAEIAVLVLEFNEGLSNRNTARSRQQLYEDFRKLRIVFARQVEVEVAGRVGELPAVNSQALAVPHPSYPTLVVESASDQLDWPLLARMSRALPLALGRPSLAMPFRVAFLEMANAQKAFEGLARPSDETIAEALGHPLARVREIYRSLRSTTQRLFECLVPLVRVMLGPDAATSLLAQEHVLVEDAQILTLLLAQGADQALATRLLDVCRSAETLDEARRALGVELAAFNETLAALGPPWVPLRFEARLRAQFDKHKEGRRAELELRVRDAYVDAFDAGSDLDDYRRQRSLEDVVFDEAWVDTFDTLPEAATDAAIGAALAGLPVSEGAAGGPLETVRQANRAVLMTEIPALRRLVVAWVDKPAEPERSAPAAWKGAQEDMLRAVVGSGALDFRVLDAAQLPAALQHAGLWPPSMPLSRDLAALGLTEEDLQARTQAEQEAQTKLDRARRTIVFGETEVDGGAERSLHLVAEALTSALGSKGFASRSGKAALAPFADPTGTSGSRGKSGRKRDKDPEYLSNEQRTLLGFAGEYAAFLYLKRTVRNVADAHWVSSMGRRFLGLPPGGDDEGYDFHIPRSRGPDLFFEVKGHRADPGTVDLERSQVSAALRLADGRQGLWSILYVAYVESSDLIAVHELPNPYAEAGKRLFRELGKGSVRLEMKWE